MAANYTTDNSLYLVNGNNLATWKAFVVKSDGFHDLPQRKENLSWNWPDEHGLEIDLSAVYFEPQEYALELIMYDTTYAALQANIKLLLAELTKTGLQHIKMAGIPGVFQFHVPGKVAITKLTGVLQAQSAVRVEFSPVNPYPVTRQFWTTKTGAGQTSQLYIITNKPLSINWGDGYVQSLAAGTHTVIRTYVGAGTYCIVVYGGVDGITTITPTNCTAL